MIIEVPDELAEDFLTFLDVAQSSFTEDQVRKFSEGEQKILEIVQLLLGDRTTSRFETVKARMEAARALAGALGL